MSDKTEYSANDWNGWSRWVINTIEGLLIKYEKLSEKLNQLTICFEVFKKEMTLRAGIWGAISGAVIVLIPVLIYLLSTVFGKK